MSHFIAQIINSKPELNHGDNTTNHARFGDFLKANERKFLKIELVEPPVFSLKKFFEGPVVQYYFYQHGLKVPFRDFRDARESLKLLFNPIKIITSTGDVKTVPGSLSGKNAKFYDLFLKNIEKYFKENKYEFPNSQEYNDWIKTAPSVNELYKPVIHLVEVYKKKKNIK